MQLFRILDDQFELNDSDMNYGYHERLSDEILEDENGKYQIKHVSRQVPCGCHPETCSHFSEKVWIERTYKTYLK